MKATEQYFPVVLFTTTVTLHKVIVTFESVNEILVDHLIMNAIEQNYPVVVFAFFQMNMNI